MRFLVDAQLPARFSRFLGGAGHDAVHTSQLPDGNRTTDLRIAEVADRDGRVVITKDRDFRDGHLLSGSPRRLMVATTGNITNAALMGLFEENLVAILTTPTSWSWDRTRSSCTEGWTTTRDTRTRPTSACLGHIRLFQGSDRQFSAQSQPDAVFASRRPWSGSRARPHLPAAGHHRTQAGRVAGANAIGGRARFHGSLGTPASRLIHHSGTADATTRIVGCPGRLFAGVSRDLSRGSREDRPATARGRTLRGCGRGRARWSGSRTGR